MPLVQDHLEHCGECRQEFEALLMALQGLQSETLLGAQGDSAVH
jgi:hypothetical protein